MINTGANGNSITEKQYPCCNGSGVQQRNDGIKILCPACNGSGKINDYNYPITHQTILGIHPIIQL